MALLKRRMTQDRVIAGWPAILKFFQRQMDRAAAKGSDSYLLWGTYHDSGAQVEAFRRVIGPMGLRRLTAVSAEQFSASGRWANVPAPVQRGDSPAITRHLGSGGEAAWRLLLSRQLEENHTARKYRYVHAVMDLLVTARGAGLRLVGCDMSRALQDRARSGVGQPAMIHLRDLHCWLAMRDLPRSPGAPRRVAMLWGQQHVTPVGVARFMPGQARVIAVQVFGRRPGSRVLEAKLANRLRLTDPLLIPVGGDRLILLLDRGRLGRRLIQTRDLLEQPLPPEQQHRLLASSSTPATLMLTRKTIKLLPRLPRPALTLPPGSTAYLFKSGEIHVAGAVIMPARGAAELDLLTGQEAVQLTLRIPPR